MKHSKEIQILLSKLRTPLPFDFICENILKTNELDCLDILTELVETDVIEENNRHYKIKQNGKI
jgi:hypothetical protein